MYGPEAFSRNWQWFNWSRNSPVFMETDGSSSLWAVRNDTVNSLTQLTCSSKSLHIPLLMTWPGAICVDKFSCLPVPLKPKNIYGVGVRSDWLPSQPLALLTAWRTQQNSVRTFSVVLFRCFSVSTTCAPPKSRAVKRARVLAVLVSGICKYSRTWL
jgi:hypothetical protein